MEPAPVAGWLSPGRRAAVCFTIDDVHPGGPDDLYDGGGGLERGPLRHLTWLLERHARLRATLFVTADWRETHPVPTRRWLARLPILARWLPLAPRLPKGTLSLDRHPAFVRYLGELPRTELALHGLHHFHVGPRIPVEFAGRSRRQCRRALRRALAIFAQAGLRPVPGLCPPGWEAPASLLDAMADEGFGFLASARDIVTAVTREARTAMSGLRGQPLLAPAWVSGRRLLHIPTNFQATCPLERALAIVECGGLLSVKAHAVKNAAGWTSADGLDREYAEQLHRLFTALEQRYGDALEWTSMGEIHERARAAA